MGLLPLNHIYIYKIIIKQWIENKSHYNAMKNTMT